MTGMESSGAGGTGGVPSSDTPSTTPNTSTTTKDNLLVDRKENNNGNSNNKQTVGKRRAEEEEEQTGNGESEPVMMMYQKVKRVRIVNNGSGGPIIYCELDRTVSNNNDNNEHDTKEMSTFRVVPFTGIPFQVQVPKQGCLFDLYDAIFTATQVPWERQLLSVNGQVLTMDDQQMLKTALPDPADTINLAIRMASGMEQAPSNPDLDFDMMDADEEEEYNFVEEGMNYEVVVNMDNLAAEAQASLQQLIIQDQSSNSSGDTTRSPTPAKIIPEVIAVKDTRLTGSAKCHFCKFKCRPALQFTCKCGNVFCHLHRYHDQHKCPVDVKAMDRAELALANPRVVGERL